MWVLFVPDPLHFSAWCWTKVQVRNLPHATAGRKKKKVALLMWNRFLFIFQCENAFWTVTNFRPITKSVAHHWSEKGKMRSGIPQRDSKNKVKIPQKTRILVSWLEVWWLHHPLTYLPPNVLPHYCFKTFIKSGMLPVYYPGAKTKNFDEAAFSFLNAEN